MPLKRLPQWDTVLLPQYVRSRAKLPFTWGENDCCLFAAGAIQAITGTDIATDFRTGYKTEAQAFALVKKLTGGTTAADAAAYCAASSGLTEYVYPLQAKRGDLVVLENDGRLIAGIVQDRYVVSVGEAGLMYLPITQVKRAWAV